MLETNPKNDSVISNITIIRSFFSIFFRNISITMYQMKNNVAISSAYEKKVIESPIIIKNNSANIINAFALLSILNVILISSLLFSLPLFSNIHVRTQFIFTCFKNLYISH